MNNDILPQDLLSEEFTEDKEVKQYNGEFTPIKRDENFDIADFIVKHSTDYSVRSKKRVSRIITVTVVVLIIISLCTALAVLKNSETKNPLYGTWIAQDGTTMEIIENYITINGSSRKYVFEDDNVIAISVNGEYYKIIYTLEGGKLSIILPSSDGKHTTIEYSKKKG